MTVNVRFGANEVSPLNSLWWLTTHSGAIDRKQEFGAVANADRDASGGIPGAGNFVLQLLTAQRN